MQPKLIKTFMGKSACGGSEKNAICKGFKYPFDCNQSQLADAQLCDITY